MKSFSINKNWILIVLSVLLVPISLLVLYAHFGFCFVQPTFCELKYPNSNLGYLQMIYEKRGVYTFTTTDDFSTITSYYDRVVPTLKNWKIFMVIPSPEFFAKNPTVDLIPDSKTYILVNEYNSHCIIRIIPNVGWGGYTITIEL